MYVFTRGNLDASDTRCYAAIKKYFKEEYRAKSAKEVCTKIQWAKEIYNEIQSAKDITEDIRKLPDHTCFNDLKDLTESINKQNKFIFIYNQGHCHWIACTQEEREDSCTVRGS
jgi:hypothetical protein